VDLPGVEKYELYDYPGGYSRISIGEVLSRLRMEAEEVPHDTVAGATNCAGFSPGRRFAIAGHADPAENGAYVITSVQHSATEPGDAAGGPDPVPYSNRFTCIPSGIPFRPERTTPKPVIAGVETAIVVGPRGSEIHTDRYGRVKVQFHWDREGKSDANSSCWIRVAHDYTRSGPVPAIIPRVGSEVVVSFLAGDPDRPLVIGRVHTASAGVFTGDDARPPPAAIRRSR
jgi:type VI secretion system secreted protein VgrG